MKRRFIAINKGGFMSKIVQFFSEFYNMQIADILKLANNIKDDELYKINNHTIKSILPDFDLSKSNIDKYKEVLNKIDEENYKNNIDFITFEDEKYPQILKNIKKGATRDEIIEAVRKTESSGIKASVTFIQGLGGEAMYREHAIDTGTMISAMEPSFVGLLTLMLDDAAEITADIREGRLKLLSPMQVCEETLLMLENINLTKECIFRSNHASNYVPLAGTLPQDKEKMMKLLVRAMKTEGFKPEGLRML